MNSPQRNVLFVDDEPYILRGYERSAEAYEEELTLSFASSGREALEIIKRTPVDVIVTDMRMPGMDGKELLEIVSRQNPEIVRFVLSGNTENLMSLQFTNLAHQFLTKPCDLSNLKKSIDQIFNLRELLNNPQLSKMINGIRDLPSPPILYNRLVKTIESDSSTSKKIAAIISQDMALTAKILQLANSAFVGVSSKIADPQRAVTVLGVNTIKALVLSVHVFSEAEPQSIPAIPVEKLWRHSMLVSSIARTIAQEAGKKQQFQTDAQIAGLMHDIGKLLMLRVPTILPQLGQFSRELSLQEEYNIFHTSHAEMGAYLLGIWGLPFEVIEATAFHHIPEKLIDREINLTSLVHIANGLYYRLTNDPSKNYQDLLNEKFLDETGLSASIDHWSEIAYNLMKKSSEEQESEGE